MEVNPGSVFTKLYQRLVDAKERVPIKGTIIALDPGVTTGIALFEAPALVMVDQNKDDNIGRAVNYIEQIVNDHSPTAIIIEDYRIYRWKQKEHAWSDLHTPRLIGGIEKLAFDKCLPLIKQPAHVAKGFCNDAKLKDWSMYIKGMRHGRDAIRHGAYYILFGGIAEWHTQEKNPHNPKPPNLQEI